MITYQLHKTLNSLIDQGLGDKALSNADYFGAVGTGENGELEYEETYPAAPIITFESAVKEPITKLAVYIEPVQSGSGDPSPDNIRPISGWDSVETVRTDANGGNRLTITTDLPSTVYGGVLDVVTGELTVDRAYIAGGWTQYNASNGYIAYTIGELPRGKYGVDEQNLPMSNMIGTFGSFSSSSMDKNIIQPPRIYSTSAYLALAEGVSPDDVSLTYLIADPQTYTLTPEELNTLVGTNTIFANAGNVSVTKIALIKD